MKGTSKFDGSTASVTLIREYQIIAGSVGDSRCVFLRNGKAMDLSTVHKPNIPDESPRIENAGGRVTRDAPSFRCLGQSGTQFGYLVNGILPLSRAGDFHFKMNTYLHPMGQACYPHILTLDITHDAEFLRIASDGIWKGNPAMVQVGSCLRQARSNASISKALSHFTLGEEKSGVQYAKSCMQALLPRIEEARAAILDLDGYRISSFGFHDGFGGLTSISDPLAIHYVINLCHGFCAGILRI